MSATREVSITLHSEIRSIFQVGCLILVVSGSILLFYGHWAAGSQWMVQSGLLWWFVYYQAYRRIDLNRPEPGADLYQKIGWANRLTILRGGLIAAVGGFLFQTWPETWIGWLPAILYTFATIIDRVDGYIARKTRHASLFGAELDTVIDALGLAIAPLLAVWLGKIHWSYILVSVAYYLFQWGVHWRKEMNLPVHELSPSLNRRAWAGFQMGFIAVILYPVLPTSATRIASVAFMLPILIGFAFDWLTVSGRIDRGAPATILCLERISRFCQNYFQPFLRFLVTVLLLLVVAQSGYFWLPGENDTHYGALPAYSYIVITVLLLLGIAGRLTSLVLIGLLAWHYTSHVIDTTGEILLTSVIWLLLLGTGRFSLWQGDSDWINRYDGAG